jgi:hypothetical protein
MNKEQQKQIEKIITHWLYNPKNKWLSKKINDLMIGHKVPLNADIQSDILQTVAMHLYVYATKHPQRFISLSQREMEGFLVTLALQQGIYIKGTNKTAAKVIVTKDNTLYNSNFDYSDNHDTSCFNPNYDHITPEPEETDIIAHIITNDQMFSQEEYEQVIKLIDPNRKKQKINKNIKQKLKHIWNTVKQSN